MAGSTGCGSKEAAVQARQPVIKSQPAAQLAAAVSVKSDIAPDTDLASDASRSVFHASGPNSGRDPFFPQARRGTGRDGIEQAPLPLLSYLQLMGIRPGTKRPLALINKTSFAPGETGEVIVIITNQNRTAQQKVSLRCLEIRQDSVLISIVGEPGVKELRLAQND
jgi:hypothetical protein